MTRETLGVLYPERLPTFHRLPPPTACVGLVRWFWLAEWDVPSAQVSRQDVLAYPACNLVVEPDGVTLTGPTTRASHRDLVGRGWVVAALLRPAAVPAFTPDPSSLRDSAVALPCPDLHRRVTDAMTEPDRATRHRRASELLAAWLADRVGEVSAEAHLANALVDTVEADVEVARVDDLAARLGVSTRTAQRLARRYVGLTPGAMIRRRRVQLAAERLRSGTGEDLAAVAGDLGYADHAHLTGEFRTATGLTPSRYRRRSRDPAS